jgi:nitric oxide reductase subunit B
VESGYWFARSTEFMQTDLMQWLRWMRVPGDTVFFFGAVALVWFVFGLWSGYSFSKVDDGFNLPDTEDAQDSWTQEPENERELASV